jgi:hypothetical protein
MWDINIVPFGRVNDGFALKGFHLDTVKFELNQSGHQLC